jgi:hypothetical protein
MRRVKHFTCVALLFTRHMSHVTRCTAHVNHYTSHLSGQPPQHAMRFNNLQVRIIHKLQHSTRRVRRLHVVIDRHHWLSFGAQSVALLQVIRCRYFRAQNSTQASRCMQCITSHTPHAQVSRLHPWTWSTLPLLPAILPV